MTSIDEMTIDELEADSEPRRPDAGIIEQGATTMPNWSHTSFKLTGPDADIERFKQAYLYAEPIDGNNGIDFSRVDEETPSVRWSQYWVDDHGHHVFCLSSAWNPPSKALIKMAEQFPTLTMGDFHSSVEGGWFFYKGSIRAGAVNVVDDEEAEREWFRSMGEAHEAVGAVETDMTSTEDGGCRHH